MISPSEQSMVHSPAQGVTGPLLIQLGPDFAPVTFGRDKASPDYVRLIRGMEAFMLVLTALLYAHPRVRRLEDEVPDAAPVRPAPEPVAPALSDEPSDS